MTPKQAKRYEELKNKDDTELKNIKIDPKRHFNLKLIAFQEGIHIKDYIHKLIDKEVEKKSKTVFGLK